MRLLGSTSSSSLYAYFNVDNGGGRIRGIWGQSNLEALPILDAWLKPLHDIGVEIVAPRSVGSSDHISFESAGLPGFQFMQDRLEYNSRSHHSNMDVYDRLQGEDMVQVATVLAVVAYSAATDPHDFPRKGLPERPTSSGR